MMRDSTAVAAVLAGALLAVLRVRVAGMMRDAVVCPEAAR
jgi:hypothetical protein